MVSIVFVDRGFSQGDFSVFVSQAKESHPPRSGLSAALSLMMDSDCREGDKRKVKGKKTNPTTKYGNNKGSEGQGRSRTSLMDTQKGAAQLPSG